MIKCIYIYVLVLPMLCYDEITHIISPYMYTFYSICVNLFCPQQRQQEGQTWAYRTDQVMFILLGAQNVLQQL